MFHYTTDEWIRDFECYCQATRDPDIQRFGEEDFLEEYFSQKYPHDPNRLHFFSEAIQFLHQHREELNVGRLSVVATEEVLWRDPLLLALYDYFASRSAVPPTVDEIKSLAEKRLKE